VQAKVESRCAQQPKQRSQRGLPLITLVCRDHCDRNSSPLSQFPLAHVCLQPRQLQERGRWRRKPFNVIRVTHNIIVLCGGQLVPYPPRNRGCPGQRMPEAPEGLSRSPPWLTACGRRSASYWR
jgi:hypothetical protein